VAALLNSFVDSVRSRYRHQPHLIRESRKLTAHTPAELVAGRPAVG
jgi:hypothetical protein